MIAYAVNDYKTGEETKFPPIYIPIQGSPEPVLFYVAPNRKFYLISPRYSFQRFLFCLVKIQKNPYHLVTKSPWPLMLSLSLGIFFLALTIKMHYSVHYIWLNISGVIFLSILTSWLLDILTESLSGHHTKKVASGLRFGFFLMVVSEVMFFISFFWALLHSTLAPDIATANHWPYIMEVPGAGKLPSSIGLGYLIVSCWWINEARIRFLWGDKRECLYMLTMTIWCSIMFLIIQADEFIKTPLSFNASYHGSIFFMMTGFHAIHVVIGLIFIVVLYLRLLDSNYPITKEKHIMLNITLMYWQFVDYVYIFLYGILYWWFGTCIFLVENDKEATLENVLLDQWEKLPGRIARLLDFFYSICYDLYISFPCPF